MRPCPSREITIMIRSTLLAVAAVAVFGITGCGSAASPSSSAPSGASDASVAQFVQSNLVASGAGITTSNQSAMCVQTSDGTFNCIATYTNSDGTVSQNYQATIIVTCDATGNCIFPAFNGTPVH